MSRYARVASPLGVVAARRGVAQLQALLAKTFDVGLDVGRGKEPVELVRLRLAKA